MSIHKNLCLHTVGLYLEEALKGEPYQKDKLRYIKTKIQGFLVFHRFSKSEHDILIELGEQEFMKKIKQVEVDFSVYALELLALWYNDTEAKDRGINLSKEKVMEYKANLVKDMLGLRLRDSDNHKQVKKIVRESQLVAKQFYDYTKENLKG